MARKKKKLSGKSSAIILVVAFILYLFSPQGQSLIAEIKDEFSGLFVNSSTVSTKGDVTGEDILRTDFIDVGQGDGALITTPDGKYILIDAGTSSGGDAVVEHLERAGVREIEYFILTHPHADHIGGAAKVFDAFSVKAVIMPDAASTSATYSRLLDKIADEKSESGCEVLRAVPGDKYTLGECSFEIFAPHSPSDDDLNNSSVVGKLVFRDFSVLFTGDAEKDSEKQILDAGYNPESDILKVPHHGSTTSLSEEYLSEISPAVAIISCEKDNSYGHPHEEIIQLLEKNGIEYFVTMDCGTVSVISDGENYNVTVSKTQ